MVGVDPARSDARSRLAAAGNSATGSFIAGITGYVAAGENSVAGITGYIAVAGKGKDVRADLSGDRPVALKLISEARRYGIQDIA